MRYKITPALTKEDGSPWNDGEDDRTIRYCSEVNEEGYFYELYVMLNDTHAAIVVTNNGVSIDFLSGDSILTSFEPNEFFNGKEELDWEDLCRIIDYLDETNCKGRRFTSEQMESFYDEWKRSEFSE